MTDDFSSDGVGVEDEEAKEAVDELLQLPLPDLRLPGMPVSLGRCGRPRERDRALLV